MAELVIGDILCRIICLSGNPVSDDPAGEAFGQFLIILDIRVEDQSALRREKLGKSTEGIADFMDVFEKIQVIFFYIKDDPDGGSKLQKAVGVLAGFGDEVGRLTDPDVPPDGGQDPSDGNRRIHAGGNHHV